MTHPTPQQIASAAAISLIAFCASVACLIPPLGDRFIGTPVLVVAIGLAIAASGVLHLVFVAMLARAMGQPAVKWVALALVTLPVGSIVALVLLEWRHSLQQAPQQPQGGR